MCKNVFASIHSFLFLKCNDIMHENGYAYTLYFINQVGITLITIWVVLR